MGRSTGKEFPLKDVVFHVCVPVYNAAKYLRQAVDSVLSQSFDNVEIILVDDGSKDESYNICQSYADSDNRVVCFHQENKGQYEARQVAIQYVLNCVDGKNDDWILFLDSDDMYASGAFKRIAEIIMSDVSLDTIVFAYESVTETGDFSTEQGRFFEGIVEDHTVLYDIVTCGKYNGYYTVWSRATRASLFLQLELPASVSSLRYGEDAVHTMMLFERSKRTRFIKDRLYIYRLNFAGVSSTLDPASMFEDHLVGTQLIYAIVKRGSCGSDSVGEGLARYLDTNCISLASRISLVIRKNSFSWRKRCDILSNIGKWSFVGEVIKSGHGTPSCLVKATNNGHYRLAYALSYFWAVQKKFLNLFKKLINIVHILFR